MVVRIPMTPQGHERLREELRHLKTVERAKNIRDIEEARAHGDLSENAEYHAAKEKQGILNGRILDLEHKVSHAEVIDPKKISDKNRIVFSATITVLDLHSEEEITYQIVGDEESNIKQNRIAISSPIARGFIGKSVGDEVRVQTPKGLREFEVVSIDYL